MTDGRRDEGSNRHTESQRDTLIPHHYCVAWYKNALSGVFCLLELRFNGLVTNTSVMFSHIPEKGREKRRIEK